MTDSALPMTVADSATSAPRKLVLDKKRVRSRYAAERRFRAYGIAAIAFGLFFLAWLFVTLILQGYGALQQSKMRLDVTLDAATVAPGGQVDDNALRTADYTALLRTALRTTLGVGSDRGERRDAYALLSNGADTELRNRVLADPSLIGKTVSVWVSAAADVDTLIKGQISRDLPENQRRLNDRQIAWTDKLVADGRLEKRFNTALFVNGASSDPEQAGMGVAIIGSLYMMLVVLLTALPVGVAAAVYLEEFAPRNRWTDLIEVNINNLAAVPSIVFGLLGLAIFLNFFGMPRSAPVVGGLVLALMTLPVVIIATRASIKAVPPSIREAALGVGASKMQVITHHVVPLALPGILTGTIIGMARALGETAPLLLIGMVAFVVATPATPFDPATALPVQIYMWAGASERAFVERTSAAILILLVFLIVMNAAAVVLRRRFERRW
ncbi:phosphate ABC transporter permease PstA [Reyranella sp. CPCC 100927]|uniref:phosphate ABC transporter permease PstA n=1 Tax=Reyranella sp. CPCC 100927 TaxID=2599616 RepID=UPI0011B5D112|nr:phosphate ABC transporter permease PstA [Reyranella sp. CPCC 100927]TWS95700.1 phosphate ABC transporter permease PstA [Reyranella sp. CPCC 100927]